MRLEEYKSVERWLNNLTSAPSKRLYTHYFERFIDFSKSNPDDLVQLAESGKDGLTKVRDLVSAFYHRLKDEGLSSKSCTNGYMAVRSFFRWNYVELGRMPKGFIGRRSYESGRILEQQEVADMVDACTSMRDKAIVTMLAQSAQRVEVLPALRLRHVKDQLDQNVAPIVVDVPAVLLDKEGRNVNKARVDYRFAFGEDTARYLKFMLEERAKNGEALDRESWLFRSYACRPEGRRNPVGVAANQRGPPISISAIGEVVRSAAEKVGIQNVGTTNRGKKRYEVHPHIFRRYWKSRMRKAGVTDNALLDFMMGHKLDYEGAYDKFSAEDTREAYKQAEPFLSLHPTATITKEDVRTEVISALMGKISDTELTPIAEKLGLSPDQIRSMIRRIREEGREEETEALLEHERKQRRKTQNNGGDCERIRSKLVTEKELTRYIDQGWDLVKELSNGKILIRQMFHPFD
jgi:integrase